MKDEMTDGMEHRDGFELDVSCGRIWTALDVVIRVSGRRGDWWSLKW